MHDRRIAYPIALALALALSVPAAGDDAAEALKTAQALVERMNSKDDATRKTAFGDAAASQHPLVTAALVKALSDADAAIRDAALGDLRLRADDAGKKTAAVGVAARLDHVQKQADAAKERLALIAALQTFAQPVALKALAAETGFQVAKDEVRARLMAIASLPCKEAVETVIQFALTAGRPGDGFDDRRQTAQEAFTWATGADCGHDAIKMKNWWKDHEKDFDFKAAAARRAKTAEGASGK